MEARLGFHAISFNPTDHELIHGDPGLRRAYFNRVISSENETYFYNIQKPVHMFSLLNFHLSFLLKLCTPNHLKLFQPNF
jgi:recombinational DNA repair ATPase RecF